MQESREDKKNRFAVNLGLFSNIILAAVKTMIGIAGHSQALLADGINSTSDVVYYIAAKIFLRMSVKPADKEHPYGHRQLESIAAIIVGSFILTTAVTIFWNSINSMFDLLTGQQDKQKANFLALVIVSGTILIKIVLTLITRSIGNTTGNNAIKALAFDHLNDIFSSLAAAIGIMFSAFGYFWIDPLAGAVVSLFILRTGVTIIKDAAGNILHTAPSEQIIKLVKEAVTSFSEIEDVGNIREHTFGQFSILTIDIVVSGDITVQRGDDLCDNLENILQKSIKNLMEVHIHYHPSKAGLEAFKMN